MEDSMHSIAKLLCGATVVLATNSPAFDQAAQNFTLEKGQAIRITPDGEVTVFSQMQGDTAHLEEMERRAQPMPKGLAVWRGADGKLRYLIEPVEDPVHIRQ
jgi:hypothetical protein